MESDIKVGDIVEILHTNFAENINTGERHAISKIENGNYYIKNPMPEKSGPGHYLLYRTHIRPWTAKTDVNNDDDVNHPPHYNKGKIECIEFIEDQELNFARGNAVKYIVRAGAKGDKTKELQDLEKAQWYCKREAERVRAEIEGREPVRPNDME